MDDQVGGGAIARDSTIRFGACLLAVAMSLVVACGGDSKPEPAGSASTTADSEVVASPDRTTGGTPSAAISTASPSGDSSNAVASSGASGAVSAGESAEGRPAILELAPAAPRSRPEPVSGVVVEPTRIRFTARLAAGGEAPFWAPAKDWAAAGVADPARRPPSLSVPLVFALPPGKSCRARVLSYRLGDAEVPPPAAGLVLQTATLRRWQVGAVRLDEAFFQPWSEATPEARGDVTTEFAIEWDGEMDLSAAPPVPEEASPDAGWGRILSRLVLNPESVGAFQSARVEPRAELVADPGIAPPWESVPDDRPWARLPIETEGFHQLDADDLIGAGFPPEKVSAAALRIFRDGRPVPLIRPGDGAGAGKVYLWNPPARSPYTKANVYWATLGPDLPDPLLGEAVPEGAPEICPATVRVAEVDRDNLMRIESGLFMAVLSMQWVDAAIPHAGGSAASLAVPLELLGYEAPDGPLPARLRIRWEQPNGERARIVLTKEGRSIASAETASPTEDVLTLSIPPGELSEGRNEFALRREASGGEVAIHDAGTTIWLDSLRLEYRARPSFVKGRMELSQPGAAEGSRPLFTPLDEEASREARAAIAVALDPAGEAVGIVRPSSRDEGFGYAWPGGTGRRLVAALPGSIPRAPRFDRVARDDLRSAENEAERVIVTHRDFRAEAERLATSRRARGESVRVVDVQSIYDEFSGGALDPRAIRAFVARSLSHWKRAPTSFLLVGDCTSDWHDVTRSGLPNLVPTFPRPAGGTTSASDLWFVTVAGEDEIPDAQIGRFSVLERADAAAIVEKTVAYEESPHAGPWRSRVGLVADDGGFLEAAEDLRARRLPRALRDQTLYLDREAMLEDNWYLPAQTVARNRLKVSPALTWRIRRLFEQGAAAIFYYGHGSPNIWMDERVWFGGNSTDSDNRDLPPNDMPAFVMTMTCSTGAIDYPIPKGVPGVSGGWNINISEDMMRVPRGGAIALFVPSGPESTPTQHRMAIEVARALFGDGLRGLGDFTTLARARYTLGGGHDSMSHMFILLGDPALELQLETEARAFDLPDPAARPGETLRATLRVDAPRGGRYVAELRSIEARRTLWSLEESEFGDGALPLRVEIPHDAPLGEASLRVFARDAEGRSVLAAARLELARPALRIASASVEREADGEFRVDLVASAPSSLPVESGRVVARDERGSILVEAPLALDARTTRALSLRFALPGADSEGRAPEAIDLALETGEPPPRGGSAGSRARLSTPAHPDWEGVIPGLSVYSPPQPDQAGDLEIVARVPGPRAGEADAATDASDDDTTATAARAKPRFLGFDSGAGETLGSKGPEPYAAPVPGGDAGDATLVRARFVPLARDADRLTTGTVWLAREADIPTSPPLRLSSAPLSAIPRPGARLRIRPESIRVTPEQPFEGQTILVRFEAENLGDPTRGAVHAALFDRDPELPGQPVVDHMEGVSRVRIDSLGTGERVPVLLRWDPVDNPGARDLWIVLEPGRESPASSGEDLVARRTVVVRKKADLVRGETHVREAPGSTREKPKFEVSGEVFNQGGIDAINVLVVFYRSPVRTQENVIGEVLLPKVPPGERMEAKIEWSPDPKELAGAPPSPNHQLKLNWRRAFTEAEE